MHAAELGRLSSAIIGPAETLVEGARVTVVLEDPEAELADPRGLPECLHRVHEGGADAVPPRVGINVHREDLRPPGRIKVVVAKRPRVDETEDCPPIGVVDSDEGGGVGVRGRPDPAAPAVRAIRGVDALEVRGGEDVAVGPAPAGNLDAGDCFGVVGRRVPDPDYDGASQVSPGSSATTSADVCSRSWSGVPERAGKVA